MDCELAFDDVEPDTGDRVQIHHGTRETPARLTWLGGRFWQVRLETPLIAVAGDRIVLRQIAPPDTLGGGRVLDAHPRRHGPGRELTAHLERRSRGEDDPVPAAGAGAPAAPPAPARETATAPLSASAVALEQILRDAGFAPPIDSELDGADLAALRAAGRAVRVGRNLHFHTESLAELRAIVIATADSTRGRDHHRPAARRARQLAQVRPRPARALRRRARDVAPRRRPRRASQRPRTGFRRRGRRPMRIHRSSGLL